MQSSDITTTQLNGLRERLSALEAAGSLKRTSSGAPIFSALTAGRVVVTGASQELATDNALVWDNANKRLGVGLTGPTARVHIAVANAETDTNAADYMRFSVAGGLVGRLYRDYNGAQNYLGIESFNVGGGVPAPIVLQEFGGHVGIGVTAPTYRLELPNIASVAGQGRAHSWVTYSSRVWKQRERALERQRTREIIKALRAIEYDLIEDVGGGRDIGLVAEDVLAVAPDIVTGDPSEPETLAIKTHGLAVLLLPVVQDLLERVEMLENRRGGG
jgi:hypothetical protein